MINKVTKVKSLKELANDKYLGRRGNYQESHGKTDIVAVSMPEIPMRGAEDRCDTLIRRRLRGEIKRILDKLKENTQCTLEELIKTAEEFNLEIPDEYRPRSKPWWFPKPDALGMENLDNTLDLDEVISNMHDLTARAK
ncbi:hypothetical protein N657DRAFT_688458 [Parathielavia appendiculata]|uniref:Uncharacterized protein n=1 Tax=Parathielavia appendiculata TaxID=2587402 RepID=A0AAN6U414_9PEZI|nr:hypothetical protein N657DRAFT_688458 [Parathielavia appendiculata]